MLPREGDLIEGKYRVERMLGSGAMGSVYRAFHVLRKAPVALKFLAEDAIVIEESVVRFLNEAVAASQIDSEHVVKVFDVGTHEGVPFLVMELLDGHDLAAEIRAARLEKRRAPIPRSVHVVTQILRGLEAAHAKGVIHRDLKPANVFVLRRDGDDARVKLVDFGISKLQQPTDDVSLTQTDVAMGTPMYMSPEQARSARDVDGRSDLYGAAAILYELLANRPPFQAGSYNELLYKLFKEEPPRISDLRDDLPPGLADVIHKGLAKDPAVRFQTAAELACALAPFAGEGARRPFEPVPFVASHAASPNTLTATSPPTIPSLPPPPMPFRKTAAVVAALGLVAAAAVGLTFYVRRDAHPAATAPSSASSAPVAASTTTAPVVTASSVLPIPASSSAVPSLPSAAPSVSSAAPKSTPTGVPTKGKLDWELSQ